MPFFRTNPPPLADGPALQSTQQPQPVCTWSAHAPQSGWSKSPFPRGHHTLTTTTTATVAGEFLLFGGTIGLQASSELYLFSTRDFSMDLLKTSGEVPSPRARHSAVLIGSTLLVHGGMGSSDENLPSHSSLYLLSLVSREWAHVVVDGPGPGGRYDHTTTTVGSKFFVFGGRIDGKLFDDMWALDLNSLKSKPLWESYDPTPGNDKPLPRCDHVSVTTEDCIIIFGGADYLHHFNHHHYNDTWSFNISTRKWTELRCTGFIPSPRSEHAAVLVEGVMYVFGGYSPANGYLDDLHALQLSTQRWFRFPRFWPSPRGRSGHTMVSDGTRVFVLGGCTDGQAEISLIHFFDTKDIKFPDPEPNAVNSNRKTARLARKSPASPPLEQPQHPTSSSLEAHGASRLRNTTHAVSGRPASTQITHGGDPGPNGRPLELTGVNSEPIRVLKGSVSESSTEYHAKFAVLHSPSEGEATRLELERQLSVSLAVQTERDQRISQLADELALKSALLEQAEANAAEGNRRAGLELREHKDRLLAQTSLLKPMSAELVDTQSKLRNTEAKLDEQTGRMGQYEKELANLRTKLEAKESELEAVHIQLADAKKGWTSLDEMIVSRDQQVGQYEKELANVHAKLEAKGSELEAIQLRLTDAEKSLAKSKAEADELRAQNATGSINRDKDQITRKLMERMRAIETEMASKRWNEKSIAEMEDRNEG